MFKLSCNDAKRTFKYSKEKQKYSGVSIESTFQLPDHVQAAECIYFEPYNEDFPVEVGSLPDTTYDIALKRFKKFDFDFGSKFVPESGYVTKKIKEYLKNPTFKWFPVSLNV